MFPTLQHTQFFPNYFEQAYIGMIDDDSFDDTLILKFKDEVFEMFDFMEGNILKQEKDTIIYEIPEDKIDDYETFLIGKYSELSDDSKKDILSFWNEDENSLLHGILYKTEQGRENLGSMVDKKYREKTLKNLDLAKSELWPQPDILGRELLIKGDE
jgi:hypothetical protein